MAKVLKGIQGKFVLSLNDCGAVERSLKILTFEKLIPFERRVWQKTPRKEVLIRNN